MVGPSVDRCPKLHRLLFGITHAARGGRLETGSQRLLYTGDRIVRFNLYTLDDNEIVAGGDDKHLDFRVSVMRVTENETHKVVVSTLIFTHNLFGKIYLLFVLPIHRFGMRRLLAQAVALGRI